MKSKRIHIRIKPEDKAKLQAVADKKRRTITSLIEEMIVKLLEEEMEKTYIVVTTDGNNEWTEYEGTDLLEAIGIARLEYGRNKKSKQNYTVELRKMSDDYESGSDAYNYDLVEFV